MVAKGVVGQPPIPTPFVRHMGYGPVRFTVSDALGMVEQGILPEDASVELLDGSLVYRDRFDLKGGEVVTGVQHDYVVTALSKLSAVIDNDRRHVRTQTTLVCGERHAPIPDFIVLRGTLADYRHRLPTAADALCVVEVADSSYERDSGEKLVGYARAAVEQYIIINLRTGVAESRRGPDPKSESYPSPTLITADQSLVLNIGEEEPVYVRLSDLLP